MTGAIWTKDVIKGNEFLDTILNRYKESITQLIHKADGNRGKLSNGDSWEVKTNMKAIKGTAYNISYIDTNLPSEIQEEIIFRAQVAFPYSGYNFF
jgi:hypothetical protein